MHQQGQSIRFGINDIKKVFIDENGFLGIGVTAPTANLDVNGDVKIVGETGFFSVAIDNGSTSIDLVHSDGSGVLVDSATSYAFKATDGVTNNFIVTNSGTLGVGTDSPDELLHVNTSIVGEGAKIGVVQIGNHITDTESSLPIATFGHSSVYDEPDSYALTQDSSGKTTLNSKTAQDICFKINDELQMVLDQDGNLGIGVTNPTNALDVFGDTKLDGNLLITGELTFSGPFVESLTFEDNLLKFAGDNTTDTLDIGFYGCYVESATTKFAGTFWDASDKKWRMFDSLEDEPGTIVGVSGTNYVASELVIGDLYVENKVGIGIASPTFALDVNGSVRADDYLTTSDERTKNVLGKVSERHSYDKIKNLEVFRYELKKDPTKRERAGFMAQQLEKIMPEATIRSTRMLDGIKVDDFRGIDQYSIVANLTNALKYCMKKIEKLEEEVLSLKIKNVLTDMK